MPDNFFTPESIAVAGVADDPANIGYRIIANLKRGGFRGDVVPLTAECGKIQGLDCYRDLNDYGEAVDLVVIASPRESVLDAARDATGAGTGAVLVITRGFRETGGRGAELEKELVDICHGAGARLMGPNSMGIINTGISMNASITSDMPGPGGVSIFSQSGAICSAMLDMASSRRLGVACVANIGNKADLDETDMIRWYGADSATKVILGYVENISSGDDFVKNAETVTAEKPVIVMRAGTTKAGRRVASSHTGVLAGEESAYCAAFKRSGVIRADSFDELFDYAAAFFSQPLPEGGRIMIVASAGGPGTVAADAVEKAGLEVADMGNASLPALRELAAGYAQGKSPVLVADDAHPDMYVAALRAGMEDDGVDAVLLVLSSGSMFHPDEIVRAVSSAADSYSKTVVISWMGQSLPVSHESFPCSIPDYPSPERAVAVIKAMYEYYQWKHRPPRLVTRFRVNRRKVARIVGRHRNTGRLFLGDIKAKKILDAYGFTTLPGGLAASASEAVEIAARIGYPVALKIVSSDIIHKTDLGGVKLNIFDSSGVEDAFDLMMLRVRQSHPSANIEGVFVEKMAERGLEVIIGMHREAGFGPMLMFGLGGIFVEVMKDVTFYLAPITENEAVQMLKSTRSYELLQGKRGTKAVDLHAIAGCLQRISQLATDFPDIMELDINPLIVGGEGSEPVVVDARMTLA